MKLLVLNTAILAAGEFTETDDSIITADAIYPKHVIDGYEVIEAELPADFSPAGYDYRDGAVVRKPPAPEEIQAQKHAHNAPIREQIAAIEARQPRAVREALLGVEGAVARLASLEADIAALRAELI